MNVFRRSFRTTCFLGRDGKVWSAHADLPGKASGTCRTEAKEELTSLVERRLVEKSAHTAAST